MIQPCGAIERAKDEDSEQADAHGAERSEAGDQHHDQDDERTEKHEPLER